jgi:hypothetical protein
MVVNCVEFDGTRTMQSGHLVIGIAPSLTGSRSTEPDRTYKAEQYYLRLGYAPGRILRREVDGSYTAIDENLKIPAAVVRATKTSRSFSANLDAILDPEVVFAHVEEIISHELDQIETVEQDGGKVRYVPVYELLGEHPEAQIFVRGVYERTKSLWVKAKLAVILGHLGAEGFEQFRKVPYVRIAVDSNGIDTHENGINNILPGILKRARAGDPLSLEIARVAFNDPSAIEHHMLYVALGEWDEEYANSSRWFRAAKRVIMSEGPAADGYKDMVIAGFRAYVVQKTAGGHRPDPASNLMAAMRRLDPENAALYSV